MANLAGLLPSDLQEHASRLSHLRRRIRESFTPHLHPHEPLLPPLPRLQLKESLKRVPRRLPRAPDRRQHLARRYLARRAVLDVAGVIFGRGVGLVKLQSLSARTMDAGASPGAEGDDREDGGGEDGVGVEMTLVRSGGGRGGIAHLEGDAIVLVHEKVRAREGEIVIEFREVLINMIAVWGKISLERTSRRGQSRDNVPENMTSLNSLHPFSNFSTKMKVSNSSCLYIRRHRVIYCLF